ncbi:sensor histidine kinase [Salinisphaera sp. USBA-960]|nr:sensor histidine kinase [Salifodinibacter halophilus]NNC26597.1 sensor histidine kinase [Salifodinibacter halophilus]
MTLVLVLVTAIQAALIVAVAGYYLSDSLYDQTRQRALMVARTVAAMPSVIDGIQARDTDGLTKLSQRLAETNEALFIVIGDQEGIRLAHPTPDQIGDPMAEDEGDQATRALQQGRAYVDSAIGSLGPSMRGKAPVINPATGDIIGIVSVGYGLDQVEATIARHNRVLYALMAVMLAASIVVAIWMARRFKRAIFDLEPETIAALFEERNATLQSVREGIIAIDRASIVTTFNRTAIETLGLDPDTQLTGRPVDDILPGNNLTSVLETGDPAFDREVWFRDRQMIVNRIPVKQDGVIIGVVASFRLRDELDQVSRQLTRIQQYADTLRSQTHEYANKLHTIAGLIQIGANEQALALIGDEVSDHQSVIHLLLEAVPDPILSGCLLGKYNRAREMGQQLVIDPDSRMQDLPDALPRDQLVSVVGNLIDNALEATARNMGDGGTVHISMTDLGHDLVFEIEDQGPGISEAQRERIFEWEVSEKGTGDHGIGLYRVWQFVNQWGGSVTVDERQPMGSRFTLYLTKTPAQTEGERG